MQQYTASYGRYGSTNLDLVRENFDANPVFRGISYYTNLLATSVVPGAANLLGTVGVNYAQAFGQTAPLSVANTFRNAGAFSVGSDLVSMFTGNSNGYLNVAGGAGAQYLFNKFVSEMPKMATPLAGANIAYNLINAAGSVYKNYRQYTREFNRNNRLDYQNVNGKYVFEDLRKNRVNPMNQQDIATFSTMAATIQKNLSFTQNPAMAYANRLRQR